MSLCWVQAPYNNYYYIRSAEFDLACSGFFKTLAGKTANQTQKPLLQLEYLIRVCSLPEHPVVLDLCCGSGSAIVAALRMGKNAFGIDRSDLQVAEARRRLDIFEAREAAENARLDEESKARLQDKAAKAAAATAARHPSAELHEAENLDP